MSEVKEISFHVVVDGRRTVVEFHREEKINDLLCDHESLGSFLRELVAQASGQTNGSSAP